MKQNRLPETSRAMSVPKRQHFKIPRAIWLGGLRICIEWDEALANVNDALGTSIYRENKIILQPHSTAYPRQQQDLEQTYFHELVHWILQKMSEDELNRNEKFIDIFASLLHQALTMAEYDYDN